MLRLLRMADGLQWGVDTSKDAWACVRSNRTFLLGDAAESRRDCERDRLLRTGLMAGHQPHTLECRSSILRSATRVRDTHRRGANPEL